MAGTFQIGEVVTLRPPCDCPELWRQLAEQLEGEIFQVTGTAQTIGADVLVLQPWAGAEIFPGYQLAPAECLQLALQEVGLICGKYWPVSVETVEAFHSIAETIALKYPNKPEMIAELRALATRWEQKLNASRGGLMERLQIRVYSDIEIDGDAARFIGAKVAQLRSAAKAPGPGVRMTGKGGRTATYLGDHPDPDYGGEIWWRIAEPATEKDAKTT